MRTTAYIEFLRRGAVLALVTIGLAVLPTAGFATGAALIVAAVLVYILIPHQRRPENALTYELMPAVIGPDLLGILLTSFFLALPFWARIGSEDVWSVVHPAAFLTWPMALITLTILYFATKYATTWVVIEKEGLRIASLRNERLIPFDEINETSPYRRGLPKWMRALTPLLIMTGKYQAAGAIILARDSKGARLHLKDGSNIVIESDAFERPFKKIIKSLAAHNVPLSSELKTVPAKRS